MIDLEITMADRPGELARMGRALGAAGVSVEGGGMWLVAGVGVAHFLVADGDRAHAALTAAGLTVAAARAVLTVRLDQETPGQLGALTAAMAEAGVNIEVLYSDHDHRLILVVDDVETGQEVCENWRG